MAEYYIAAVEEITDENGMKYIAFKIRNRNKKTLLEKLMYDGIEIVSGAALAACTLKWHVHPICTLGFSAMSIEGGVNFYKHLRKWISKLSLLQKARIRPTITLAAGTFTYFAYVVAFSRALRQNKNWITYLGGAAGCYFLSVYSYNMLGQTILDMNPVSKCCQFLFGPTLITSAAFYLLRFQKHDEEWLRWFLLVASTAVANYTANDEYLRVFRHREPRGLLFKQLELLVGGCMICISGTVLLVYAINKNFRPLLTLCCSSVLIYGVSDVYGAILCFQRYAVMDEQVFDCICRMIVGPIIFFSACICFKLVKRFYMLPGFLFISGVGLAMLLKGVLTLHDLVTPPVFIRYCRRVLGPVVIAYSTFTSAYLGYRMGWRYSVTLMPLIPFGINATYRGWRQ